jgi:monothiol glutaredoxin
MSLPEPIRQRIQNIVDNDRVVLFMKGNAQMPQCGFSARTIEVLNALGVPFETVDVLSDPDIRQGIKAFSDWPTIPQLYIDKEFIGGSDIVSQMFASGELHQAVGVTYEAPKPPDITVTEAFVAAIQAALADAGGDLSVFPRIQISPSFEYGIGLSNRSPGDLEVEAGGLVFLIDSDSAGRADGMRMDFNEAEGGGVVIDNPNEPVQVQHMSPSQLQELRTAGTAHHLIDVRSETEWATAKIDGAILMNATGQRQLDELPKDSLIVVMCHHGIRSAQAAQQLLGMGFTNVHNLMGGIEAWSTQVDAGVPRY